MSAVAMRRLVRLRELQAGAAGRCCAALPPRDLSAHLVIRPRCPEFDSKSLLRDAGIALPDEVLVTERDELDAAIARAELPLVMKIQSRDIPHKSEGRRRSRQHHDQGRSLYGLSGTLLDNARKHRPDAAIQGVLVGPMAKKGVEIIVGTLQDETFGPMIMVGLGGITTELFRDVIYRPAPVSAAEASAMLDESQGRAAVEWIPRCREGRCRRAVAVDFAGVGAGGAACPRKFRRSSSIRCWCTQRGRGVTIVDALVVGKG